MEGQISSSPVASPSTSSSAPNMQAAKSPKRTNGPPQNQEKDVARKIMVSGYPVYTQPQDLSRTFSQFGTVKVDRSFKNFSVLQFTTEEEAQAALQAGGKVALYGGFPIVAPYVPRAVHAAHAAHAAHVAHVAHAAHAAHAHAAHMHAGAKRPPKRNFARSKKKASIIDPKEIDLTGDFNQQQANILEAVTLSKEEISALDALYTDLETTLQTLWPGCEAVPFGSITTGLGIKSSDADCFIHLPAALRHPHIDYVKKTAKLLRGKPEVFCEIVSITHATVPIVKFFHKPTGTNCDVSFKSPLSTRNSRLLAALLASEPRATPLALLVKYWAKLHGFTGTGRLSNYALSLLVVFFLQRRDALPPLQRLRARRQLLDTWDVGFAAPAPAPAAPAPPVADLLGGFFEFYATFDFDEMLVCPFLGRALRKDAFAAVDSLPDEFEVYKMNTSSMYISPFNYGSPMCVQDPIKQTHNVASPVSPELLASIRLYLEFAAGVYVAEKENACADFLRIVLTHKVKTVPNGDPKSRSKLKYKHNVNKVLKSVATADKRMIARTIVLLIFEQILKIKMHESRDESKPQLDKKEIYVGVVTKPIWKRSNVYSNSNNGSFVEQQAQITETVLQEDTEEMKIVFELVFFCDASNAIFSLKHVDGDVDQFAELGRLFRVVMTNWFIKLLTPYRKTKRAPAVRQRN